MSHPWERACPKCGALPRQACQGKRGDRKSMHRERWRGFNFTARAGADDAQTESPIEAKLMQAIRGWMHHHGASGFTLLTQCRIGPYRADLLVTDTRRDEPRKLVVECDGRDFHSREKDMDRDRRRDRWFAANHIAVMRFSGAEIHRDARGCAAQVGLWMEASL